jgi:hypothetical protein
MEGVVSTSSAQDRVDSTSHLLNMLEMNVTNPSCVIPASGMTINVLPNLDFAEKPLWLLSIT